LVEWLDIGLLGWLFGWFDDLWFDKLVGWWVGLGFCKIVGCLLEWRFVDLLLVWIIV
jgi:hypothetical protein